MLAAAPDPSRGKVCWVLGAAHAAGVPSPVRIVLFLLIQRLFLKGLLVTPLPLQATYVTSQCSQPGIQAHTSAGQRQLPVQGFPGCRNAGHLTCLQACTSHMLSTGTLSAGSAGTSHAEYPATHGPSGLRLCFPK